MAGDKQGDKTLRVVTDTAGMTLDQLLAALLEMGKNLEGLPLALGPGMWADLVRLTGDYTAAMRRVADLARDLGFPVVVNVPRGGGDTSSVVIGPPDWTQEKVDGWVGGIHEMLAQQFGPIAGPLQRPNRHERRRRGR